MYTMIQHIFVLLLAGLVTLQVDSTPIKNIRTKPLNIKPHDVVDDAGTELEDLKELVVRAIATAQNNLTALESDFMSLGDNLIQTGTVAIQREYQDVLEKLKVIKNFAETAGVEYSSCTTRREEVLGEWATEYSGQIGLCIGPQSNQANQSLQDARYFVDIYINKVNQLEFELGLCAPDNTECVTPIVTQIETEMVQLPQEIQTEVDLITEHFENMKPSVQRCSDLKVDEYEFDGSALLNNIEDCVNQLLPHEL